MKLVKSLLLGSAAGLVAVAGAQAADLPVKKAAPVEYVRVCTAYGAGFFYIPGTDTCLRVGGFAQFAYQYTSSRGPNPDLTGFRTMGRVSVDGRTDTAYGTLRTFIRLDMRNGSGAYLHSGTAVRMATAFTGTGVDTAGRLQTYVELDKAFIQFAGFTAGRASSFFDFYAHANEIIGASFGSDVSATNLLAYTATFGGGFSATISMEDPTWRRQPVFTPFNAVGGLPGQAIGPALGSAASTSLLTPFPATGAGVPVPGGGFVGGALTGLFANTDVLQGGATAVTPVPVGFINGNPAAYALLDVAQRQRMPDPVANLRLDQTWGSAQISAAAHEIYMGKFVGAGTLAAPSLFTTGLINTANTGLAAGTVVAIPGTTPGTGVTVGTAGTAAAPGGGTANVAINGAPLINQPSAKYGGAVQGGVKINLPMIAAGDVLYLQAAYSKGALRYTCVYCWNGSEAVAIPIGGKFVVNTNDAVVLANGQVKLSDSWNAMASYKHFWTPTISSSLTGSIGGIQYPGGSRFGIGPFVGSTVFPGTASAAATAAAFNSTLKNAFLWQIVSNVNWTPVRGLDIGVEAVYTRARLTGFTADATKFGAANAVAGVPLIAVRQDESLLTRLRIQRDF